MSDLIAFAEKYQNVLTLSATLVTVLATLVIAAATVIYAALTRNLAEENRRLREAGTEPQVIAYLVSTHAIFLNFVLMNIGRGVARNVKFEFIADPEDFAAHQVEMKPEIQRRPLSVLPQGEKLVTLFGRGPELLAEPPLKPFSVRVNYENIHGDKMSEHVFILDVSEFLGIITLGTPPERQIADALKKIADNTDRWTSGFKRLQVETITTEEVREEQREQYAEMKRRRDKNKDQTADGSIGESEAK